MVNTPMLGVFSRATGLVSRAPGKGAEMKLSGGASGDEYRSAEGAYEEASIKNLLKFRCRKVRYGTKDESLRDVQTGRRRAGRPATGGTPTPVIDHTKCIALHQEPSGLLFRGSIVRRVRHRRESDPD